MVIHCKIWLCGHGEGVVYYVVCDLVEPRLYGNTVASKSRGSTTVIWTVLVLATGTSWGLLDLTFCLANLLWLFDVERLFVRCLDISSAVRPGQVEKFPLLIAEINLVGTREKAAWW